MNNGVKLIIRKMAAPVARIAFVILLLELGLRLDLGKLLSLQDIANRFSARQKNTYRIVCVGSSMLTGGPNAFPRQIEAILNAANTGHTFSIINEGDAGNNSTLILQTLEEILDTHDPWMVIAVMGIRTDENIAEKDETKGARFFLKHSRIFALMHSLQQGARKPGANVPSVPASSPRIEVSPFSGALDGRNAAVPGQKMTDSGGRTLPGPQQGPGAGAYVEDKQAVDITLRPINGKPDLTVERSGRPAIIISSRDGKLHVRRGQYADTENGQRYLKSGGALLRQSNYSEAGASLDKALAAGLEKGLLYDAGNLSRWLGDYSRAKELFRLAISLDPGNAAGYVGLARTYRDLRNFAAAEQAFRQAIEVDPDNALPNIALAQFYFQRKNYGEAEKLFRKDINFRSSRALTAYTGLGRLYHRLGRFSAAEEMFRKAIEINPKHPTPYDLLGELYMDHGDYSEAEQILLKAEELLYGKKNAPGKLTKFYQFRIKERFFNERVRANPGDIRTYLDLGDFYLTRDLWYYWQAERVLKQALEAEPGNNDVYIGLSRIYERRKDYVQAKKIIDEALRRNPGRAVNYDHAGNIYRGLGNYDGAEKMFRRALEINPRGWRSYEGLAKVLLETGKKAAAIRMLKEAVQLDLNGGEPLRDLLAEADPEAVELKNSDGDITYSPMLIENYRRIAKILKQRGIRLVCVQYPLRRVGPLIALFEDKENIIFVDNHALFKNALARYNYYELFSDSVHGDFGHLASRGHTLLAENIARTLLKEVFTPGAGPQ